MNSRYAAPRNRDELENALRRLDATPHRLDIGRRLLDWPETGEPGVVSVIVPVWGDATGHGIRAALKSVQIQQGVRVELILAEQGHGDPKHADLARAFGARHVFEKLTPPPVSVPARFSGGRVRNAGVAAATGQYVYLCDGDIVLADPRFLAGLVSIMERRPELVLVWPRQKHLIMEHQEAACAAFEQRGTWTTQEIENLDPWTMRWIGPGADGPKAIPPKFREAHMGAMPVVVRQERLDRYVGSGGPDGPMAGYEPSFWLSCRADGAVMARRRQWEVVGGVCERYVGWGCEDNDFQWKLSQLFDVVSLSAFAELVVVHLEHTRDAFDRELWERNQALLQRRRDGGVLDAIAADILHGAAPLADQLRDHWRLTRAAPTA